jgi:hypothetical protein
VVPYRSDGRTFTLSNFHTKASRIRTKGMVVRMIDLMHAIPVSDAHASGPRRLTSGRLDFEYDTYLMDERVWKGIHVVRTVAVIFPLLCFIRKSHTCAESSRSTLNSGILVKKHHYK